MNLITPHQAEQTDYDVVIVGGGIAGSLMAKTLTRGGKRCLILEAGDGDNLHYADTGIRCSVIASIRAKTIRYPAHVTSTRRRRTIPPSSP